MTQPQECPGCGATLSDDEQSQGRCDHCGAEVPRADEDRPDTAEERSGKASEESLPASDPPAW
ncbi:hypothetical protein BH18ACT15_BH18ACT15_14050 [soil metagenome]